MDDDLIDYEVRPRKRPLRCQCGTDLPGTCPGPLSCPYSGLDDAPSAWTPPDSASPQPRSQFP